MMLSGPRESRLRLGAHLKSIALMVVIVIVIVWPDKIVQPIAYIQDPTGYDRLGGFSVRFDAWVWVRPSSIVDPYNTIANHAWSVEYFIR
ncbi:hypothetical protein PGT21_016474 [Puccinia graminis f. sp. tritici]|uniref:Uncharacterized protein n=1 Tax=Puccinia graminis f. sp. tritici TaxID=56615 RepID=A0A5B0LZ93_PUCGR|nr:hypothetical protein PGT21_016474 [Puccinia graminis f. sp. tritici]